MLSQGSSVRFSDGALVGQLLLGRSCTLACCLNVEDLSVLHSQTRKNLVTPKSIRLAAPQLGFKPDSPGEMTVDLKDAVARAALPGPVCSQDHVGLKVNQIEQKSW